MLGIRGHKKSYLVPESSSSALPFDEIDEFYISYITP